MFDATFTLSSVLNSLHPSQNASLQLFTESKTLFAVIPKTKGTSEKWPVFEKTSAREGFEKGELETSDLSNWSKP